ncbi:hypothetical protein ScPMuIL_010743 [Solemya velum]
MKMVKRKFDRTVVKRCIKCQLQMPVACKYCTCGNQFTTRAKTTPTKSDKEDEIVEGKRKRPERSKREKPDFFKPLDLEKQTRKPRRRQESTASTSSAVQSGGESPRKKRGRPRKFPPKAVTEQKKPNLVPLDEDMFANIPAEKAEQFSIILSELNRKMITQHFKPV